MSQFDITNCLVSIDKYDPDKHFDKVFCLACEYLSSFHSDKDLDITHIPLPQVNIPASTATITSSTANGAVNQAKAAGFGNPAQCRICHKTPEFLMNAKELAVELIQEVNQGIASEAMLRDIIGTEVDAIYPVHSEADALSKTLIVEILMHMVHLASYGQCLVASITPREKGRNASASSAQSFIGGVLHYETGDYSGAQASNTLDAQALSRVDSYCYISKVYVRPELRRQSIASDLLSAAGDFAHQDYMLKSDADLSSKVLVFLDTIQTFAPAINLYKSMHFKPLDEKFLPSNFDYEPNKLYLYTLR